MPWRSQMFLYAPQNGAVFSGSLGVSVLIKSLRSFFRVYYRYDLADFAYPCRFAKNDGRQMQMLWNADGTETINLKKKKRPVNYGAFLFESYAFCL